LPNTVILRGDQYTTREDRCNLAITPGMLCDFAGNDRLTPHASAGGYAPRIFALESDYNGNGATTAYISGDRVVYADCAPGVIVYAHLASGQNVARGALLKSNGAGFLTARGDNTSAVVAAADEDADASSGIAAGGSLRFKARVI
jgi:hypothetical protein